MRSLFGLAPLIAIVAAFASAEVAAWVGVSIAHAADVRGVVTPEGISIRYNPFQKYRVLLADNRVLNRSDNASVYSKTDGYGCGRAATLYRSALVHDERRISLGAQREVFRCEVACSGYIISGSASKVFQNQNGRESSVLRSGGLYAVQVDVSPQLPSGRIFGAKDKSIGGVGQPNGEQSQDHCEQGDHRPIILASREASASNVQLKPNDRADENAAFFVKGLIGLVVFAFAYALLKRL